ncbi:ubiquitin-conjugating enzyme E2 D2B-like [Mytilus edulis]|uniref:ubiquitin-conjugating enzyme E2 D2B-like n=1 Tax=Mytilus edulis TaxID=6550 RepID=UPI0039F0881B
MTLLRRLKKEFLDISQNPPPGISASPIDDEMINWKGMISGPDGSPYAGGHFCVQIRFPGGYPIKPPKVHFTTKIYHPNINEKGEICENHLSMHSVWWPKYTISNFLVNISELLASPDPGCLKNEEAADLYKLDINKYNEKAARCTRKSAM